MLNQQAVIGGEEQRKQEQCVTCMLMQSLVSVSQQSLVSIPLWPMNKDAYKCLLGMRGWHTYLFRAAIASLLIPSFLPATGGVCRDVCRGKQGHCPTSVCPAQFFVKVNLSGDTCSDFKAIIQNTDGSEMSPSLRPRCYFLFMKIELHTHTEWSFNRHLFVV